MNSIEVFPDFGRQLKRLHKKYPTLKSEIAALIDILAENADYGTRIGNGLYKIRLASKSKSSGKSGGFRVITYTALPTLNDEQDTTFYHIYLVAIYDKLEISNISKHELLALLKEFLG